MNINFKDRQVQIAAGIILLVLIGGFFMMSQLQNRKNTTGSQEEVLPETEIFPTVDASVQVEITADSKKQEVSLSIANIPAGTESIEYELSYTTIGNLPKGVIGTIDVVGKSSIVKDEITLGTCSSGACVYDKGVKSIDVSLRFDGKYGSKVFQKEFKI